MILDPCLHMSSIKLREGPCALPGLHSPAIDTVALFLYSKEKECCPVNETLNTLKNRCSVKNYTDRQVPDAVLDAILEAGLYAPSEHRGRFCVLWYTNDHYSTFISLR